MAKKMKPTPWPMAAERQCNNLIADVEELQRLRATMLEALESAERCLAVYEQQGGNNVELLVVRRAIQTAKDHPPA